MLRRKAAWTIPLPENTQNRGDRFAMEFAEELDQVTAKPSHKEIEVEEADDTETKSAKIIEHESTEGNPVEAAAFSKLSCGLKCIEQALSAFAEYEKMEAGEEDVEGEKKEKAALKKIDDLLEKMKKVHEELADAEIEEHKEKSEVEAEELEEDLEEVEVEEEEIDKKEAAPSGKAIILVQDSSQGFVPPNFSIG